MIGLTIPLVYKFINLYNGVVLNPIESEIIFHDFSPVVIDDIDFTLYASFIINES